MEICKLNKFECNFCGKNFTCGKSLGGHIRIHKNEKLVRVAEKQQQHKERRSNILKIQVPRKNKRDSDYELRENPKKKMKQFCRESRDGFESLFWHFEEKRLDFDYKKRKIIENRSNHSCKRVELAAISLIMMSRDLKSSEWEALHLVEQSSSSSSASDSNTSSDSESFRDELRKKVKLKVSVNGRAQIDPKYKKDVKFRRSDQMGGASSSYKYELRKKISSSNGYSNHPEMVRSHHRNSHCEWTHTDSVEPRNGKNRVDQSYGNEEKKSSPSTSPKKKHKCPICLKTFKSGQALGGHKRSHVVGSLENASIMRRQESNNNNRVTGLIDLNVPAPMEDEEFGRWG